MESGQATFKRLEIESVSKQNEHTSLFTFRHSLGSKPGQFVMAWIPGVGENPMSVAFEDEDGFSLLVSGVGDFSKKFVSLKKGDGVWIRGPFGNSFTPKGKRMVLIGGGFGVAPLWFFSSQNKEADITLIQGARSKEFLLLLPVLKKLGKKFEVCTDDGSIGFKGFTTDLLKKIMEKEKVDCVYACGPEKMLFKILQLCNENGVECQLSLERYMKCGFGICGQCDCDGLLVCRDGTVFNGKQLKGNKEFGLSQREPSGLKKQRSHW